MALVGQERAIERLRRAAARGGHAFLVVGPSDALAEEAARVLATALLGLEGIDAERVHRGVHPDVVEVEPTGPTYRVNEDVRGRIVPEVHRAPVEAGHKVVVIREAERLRGGQGEAANALLKTLEEPPGRTVLILTTAVPDDLLPTILSRCQRIDLDPLDEATLREALVAAGTEPEAAALAARLAGGDPTRAAALAGPWRRLRDTFVTLAARVDGTAATAVALAAEADAAVVDAAQEVARRQEAELGELDAEMEAAGYEPRVRQRLRRRVEERHKRENRRLRQDLLVEGLTALETVYRDVLGAPAEPLSSDRERLSLSPRAAAEALDACREARRAFATNEKGTLHLERLLLALPPAGGRS